MINSEGGKEKDTNLLLLSRPINPTCQFSNGAQDGRPGVKLYMALLQIIGMVQSKTKTIKIAGDTHASLLRQGNAGETFDDIIKRLITIANLEDVLLLYRITNRDPPREMHLKNPLYYWTEENYKKFFELASSMFPDWVEDIIRYITKDEKLFKIVKKYSETVNA